MPYSATKRRNRLCVPDFDGDDMMRRSEVRIKDRVIAARSKVAIPVAWTFMSEILTRHGRIIERLSIYNRIRFDRVSWLCDGHECPSYIGSFHHRAQNLTHLQHDLKSEGS